MATTTTDTVRTAITPTATTVIGRTGITATGLTGTMATGRTGITVMDMATGAGITATAIEVMATGMVMAADTATGTEGAVDGGTGTEAAAATAKQPQRAGTKPARFDP